MTPLAAPGWSTPERVLYVGGMIHTPAAPFATAMLVDGGTIAWVGTDSAGAAFRDVADRIVRLDGALLAPGFVDAHVHATRTGLALTGGAPDAAPAPPARRAAQRAARAHAAAAGIVAVHEMGGPASGVDDLTSLLDLAAVEPGPLVVGYWGQAAADGGIATAREIGAAGVAGDLFVDGSLDAGGAWLSAPYADDPTSDGTAHLTLEHLTDHLVAATAAGLPAGFHAVGDRACAAVAEAVAAAARVLGADAVRRAGHRIEQAAMVDDATARTFVEYGVGLSMRPVADQRPGDPATRYAERLGPERVHRLNRFADLAAAGVVLAFGSGAPTTRLDPWAGVRAAVHHRTPSARVSARSAFAAYTRGGWRIIGQADTGVLRPGAPAHLAIWDVTETVVQVPDERVAAWSTDPRSATPGLPVLDPDAPTPTCLRTVVHGTVVHDAGRLHDEPA